MKKLFNAFLAFLSLAFCLVCLGGCNKAQEKTNKVKIGIAKITQHVALDDIEKGIQDQIVKEGVDCQFILENANGDVGTASQIATKFLQEKVDVAVGISTPVAIALANKIKDIPVIFGTVTDPVGAGLVSSLACGEKNVTGTSDAIPTKEHIKLFKEVAGLETLGYIYTAGEANSLSALEQVKEGCKEQGLELVTQSISNSSEVKQAATSIVNRVDGIYLSTDNTIFSGLSSLIEVFSKNKKPIFSGDVTGAMQGGIFMASGFNYYKAGLATGKMVLDVLNGTKPEDIPIGFMTDPKDSDLLIDLDAAKNCNIQVTGDLLQQANMIYSNGKLEKK